MENTTPTHDMELYPFETFNILLEYEVNRSRRYKESLTFIHLAVETGASGVQAQHGAEIFAINALNLHLRETDIPCRQGNEFLVLMPLTDEKGGLVVCERLEKMFERESQIYKKVDFELTVFIGMATIPAEHSISSKRILENAEQALRHARKNQLTKTVLFSDMQK